MWCDDEDVAGLTEIGEVATAKSQVRNPTVKFMSEEAQKEHQDANASADPGHRGSGGDSG